MEFSELETGQIFVILGKKTPHGFITLEDGLTHYGLDPDTPVSIQVDTQMDVNVEIVGDYLKYSKKVWELVSVSVDDYEKLAKTIKEVEEQ